MCSDCGKRSCFAVAPHKNFVQYANFEQPAPQVVLSLNIQARLGNHLGLTSVGLRATHHGAMQGCPSPPAGQIAESKSPFALRTFALWRYFRGAKSDFRDKTSLIHVLHTKMNALDVERIVTQ